MRIGIDFDGTIADAVATKIAYARERWGVELAPAQTMREAAIPVIGRERYEAMVTDVFASELSLRMPPMPCALEALRRLGADHELYVVTARLDHEVDLARRWLDDHEVAVHGLRHTARAPKADACRELGVAVHLDDLADELVRLAEAGLCEGGVCAALLDAAYNRGPAPHRALRRVPDWPAFEALCADLAANGPAGEPAVPA